MPGLVVECRIELVEGGEIDPLTRPTPAAALGRRRRLHLATLLRCRLPLAALALPTLALTTRGRREGRASAPAQHRQIEVVAGEAALDLGPRAESDRARAVQ